MAKSDPQATRTRETLFEFKQIGGVVRVAAVDTVTNVEVTVVAPPGTSREDLMRLAERKLAFILSKRGGQ